MLSMPNAASVEVAFIFVVTIGSLLGAVLVTMWICGKVNKKRKGDKNGQRIKKQGPNF